MEPEATRKLCSGGVDEAYLLAGEEIFWNGQMVNRMLFLVDGDLSYCYSERREQTIPLIPGDFCCEECIWAAHPVLSGPLVASAVGCEVFKVDPVELQDVARLYPHSMPFIVKYAETFIAFFNNASQTDEGSIDNLLFNDVGPIERIVVSCLEGTLQLGAFVTAWSETCDSTTNNGLLGKWRK